MVLHFNQFAGGKWLRIEVNIEAILEKFDAARKKTKRKNLFFLHEEWFDQLFDISRCKCAFPPIPSFYNRRVSCPCPWINRMPREDLDFSRDQRSKKRMLISLSLDGKFNSETSSN